MNIENAKREDARALARLIDIAGEGIPHYLWSRMAAPGQDALTVGELRASREDSTFSYTNTRTCVEDGTLMGMLIAYRLPDPYAIDELEEYPEVIRPLIELEAKAPGSWYINAVATFAQYRGRGIATRLIKDAEARGHRVGCNSTSLIVASENEGARRLYRQLGYQDRASLPLSPIPGGIAEGEWRLMMKPLSF